MRVRVRFKAIRDVAPRPPSVLHLRDLIHEAFVFVGDLQQFLRREVERMGTDGMIAEDHEPPITLTLTLTLTLPLTPTLFVCVGFE